jgi:hypothetical protein
MSIQSILDRNRAEAITISATETVKAPPTECESTASPRWS